MELFLIKFNSISHPWLYCHQSIYGKIPLGKFCQTFFRIIIWFLDELNGLIVRHNLTKISLGHSPSSITFDLISFLLSYSSIYSAFDAYLGGLEQIRNTKIVDQNIPKTRKVSSKSEYGNIQLNELKLIGTLGVGGFGRVELVQYKNKTTFALKSLKKMEMLQQQQQEHAYNEKEILFACNSPFIVR